jgi:excisionase family DNA binding protein
MAVQSKSQHQRRTINLWPDAGRQLGLGKNATYEAAERGEIPGVFRIGGRWLVSREAFDRALAQPGGAAA